MRNTNNAYFHLHSTLQQHQHHVQEAPYTSPTRGTWCRQQWTTWYRGTNHDRHTCARTDNTIMLSLSQGKERYYHIMLSFCHVVIVILQSCFVVMLLSCCSVVIMLWCCCHVVLLLSCCFDVNVVVLLCCCPVVLCCWCCVVCVLLLV
jgi:hypothetical protein